MRAAVVFPADPVEPRRVDTAFETECAAAAAAGFDVGLVSLEGLGRGGSRTVVTRVPAPGTALYRGWMVRAEHYEHLETALSAHGVALITSAAQYRHTHHFSESWPLIQHVSPRSVWLADGPVDFAQVAQVLAPFGDGPVIVKDQVKSEKHDWATACFIPRASDSEVVRRVVSRFLELRGAELVGGLVFREFIELERLATHSKSGMPLAVEFRSFVLDGRPLFTSPYWGEGASAHAPPEALFADVVKAVRSRFFSLDVARRTSGEWVVMELGDGQVSGLPPSVSAEHFYSALATRLRD